MTALAADSARSVAHALHHLRVSLGDGGAHARDIVAGLVETRREGLVPASPSSINPRARHGDEGGGNHISRVLVPLPIGEADARARYDAVRRASEHLKHASHEVEGAAFIERIGDLGGPNIVSTVFRIASMLRAFNVTITNVPGPQMPLYVGRAALTAIHAVVPLFTHQGVGVAILSYNGGTFIGLYADPDAVPDVEALAGDVHGAFEELCALAGC